MPQFGDGPEPRQVRFCLLIFHSLQRWGMLPMRLVLLLVLMIHAGLAQAAVPILQNGKPAAVIVVDATGAQGEGESILNDASQWLATSLERASGAKFVQASEAAEGPALIIARADAWPQVAKGAGLKPNAFGAYAIVPRGNHVFVLGNTEAGVRHGVAALLRQWGFRWLAPSPRWWIMPKLVSLEITESQTSAPALIDRRIWYAYGMGEADLKPLQANYQRWAIANQLSLRSPVRTGHSYGHIIGRNQEAFAAHPEYYALRADGTRDSQRAVNARKFCVSNPGLVRLVIEDRRKLLEANRKVHPANTMVSIDPSDGEGVCLCKSCAALGTPSDRVFHLANAVAKGLRVTDPEAWVGLYAYSSHRLPPTIDVEPNVYVQVAMGFNRTQYSLPELVERWSKKVGAIGLREYYGVEAWDWGLPGRARGGRVGYHQEWIPFYAARKLNAINAETNANWGAQALGLYVAARLMWEPQADAEQLSAEFYQLAFGKAAPMMKQFYERMETSPPLRPSVLRPFFENLETAWQQEPDEAVRERLTDLKSYLVFVAQFREFDLVRGRNPSRDDVYYAALKTLMTDAYRMRHRDMVHYYALARRLCNGLPRTDNRPEFWMFRKEAAPVWKYGEPFTDKEITARFAKTHAALKADPDPTVNFSRYLDDVKVPGAEAVGSRIHADARKHVARFRRGLLGYLVPGGPHTARLGIAPSSKPVSITVTMRSDIIYEKTFKAGTGFQEAKIELPRAFEYHVEITGSFELQVPPGTPFMYEASAARPAWVDYTGGHYFYVPKGTREVMVDAGPRLSIEVPGQGRRDLTPAQRAPGANHIVVKVPAGADGTVWHTHTHTRGQFSLLNIPPLLSFHRNPIFVPREISEGDGLTTQK